MKSFFLGLICLIITSGCAAQNLPYQETQIMMGTYVTIKIQDPDKSLAVKKEVANKAFAEIKRLEDLLSSFKVNSVVAKINSAGVNEVLLDDDTFFVLKKAKYFSEISEGAFDITVLPLLELWGFHKRNFSVPGEGDIKNALTKVGSNKMILDKQKKSIRFPVEGMRIDLGGIGKGYAVDRAAAVLKENGVKNALVAAAGDIYCIGEKSPGHKWSVGIRNSAKKNKISRSIELKDEAISTSGGYENYFEAKGKRFIHILDPRTGRPVDNDLLSVTVIAPDCTSTDALATAITVLGKEKGMRLIEDLKGVKTIVITKDSVKSK